MSRWGSDTCGCQIYDLLDEHCSIDAISGEFRRLFAAYKKIRNAENHTGGGDGQASKTEQDGLPTKKQEEIEEFKNGWIYQMFDAV